MGLLDEVISAALGSKASTAPGPAPQGMPAQDQFSQIAAALQELLAPKQAAAPTAQAPAMGAGQEGSSGLDMLLRQFQQNGFGEVINSWIGTGQNQPISPTQLRQAIGQKTVNDLSDQTGVPHDDLLSQLAKILPVVIDKLTPNGQLPNQTGYRGN